MSQDHDPERNEWMEQSQRWLSLNPCHFAWRVVELPVANNPNSALYGASIRIALYSLLFQCLTKQARQDILPELQRPPGKNKCAVRSFRLLGCKNPYQTHTSRGVLYDEYSTSTRWSATRKWTGTHSAYNILMAVLMLGLREVSGHHWTCMWNCKTAFARSASPLADENPTHK